MSEFKRGADMINEVQDGRTAQVMSCTELSSGFVCIKRQIRECSESLYAETSQNSLVHSAIFSASFQFTQLRPSH
jgi:hypothetical protein